MQAITISADVLAVRARPTKPHAPPSLLAQEYCPTFVSSPDRFMLPSPAYPFAVWSMIAFTGPRVQNPTSTREHRKEAEHTLQQLKQVDDPVTTFRHIFGMRGRYTSRAALPSATRARMLPKSSAPS